MVLGSIFDREHPNSLDSCAVGATDRNAPHCTEFGLRLSSRGHSGNLGWRKTVMAWTTPTLVEICIGLEINGYLPAEI